MKFKYGDNPTDGKNYVSVKFCQNVVMVSRKSNKNYILLNIHLLKMQNLTNLLKIMHLVGFLFSS